MMPYAKHDHPVGRFQTPGGANLIAAPVDSGGAIGVEAFDSYGDADGGSYHIRKHVGSEA